MGLLLDVLTGSVLGGHALALLLVAYIVAKFHIRLRLFGLLHKTLIVFIIVVMYQALLFWVSGFMGHAPNTWLYWLPSLTSTIFWPWVYILLDHRAGQYRIH